MSRFFDLNNIFWRLVSALADVIGLSLLFLACCVPVVTAGSAASALYYAVVKCVRPLEGGAFRAYFRSFRQNLRQGMAASVAAVPLTVVVLMGWWFVFQMGAGKPWGLGLLLGYGILTSLPMGMVLYLFPVLARFEYSLGELFRAALHLSMSHLLTTALLRLVNGVLLLISAVFLLPAVVTPALAALVWSFVMERAFRAFSPELAAQREQEMNKEETE